MTQVNRSARSSDGKKLQIIESVRRAFAEFLTIPTVTIAVFLALGVGLHYLDRLRIEHGWRALVLGTHESISTLLGTIAASIITVTSITFSLLLIAVQQGAAALTSQVYDQFLRRRTNQAYFGFFIGLALYCLIILATVSPGFTPVYGATVAYALTVVALYLLILLIYATIDQMRPVMIVQAIRDHTLTARETQRELLAATRPDPSGVAAASSQFIRSPECGFLTSIDICGIEEARQACAGAAEVILLRSIGDYVAVGEDLIELRYAAAHPSGEIEDRFLSAMRIEHQRDLATDTGFGIDQLAIIGWTSASTSKSNPQPALLVCWSLRDLVANWFSVDRGDEPEVERAGRESGIVYTDVVPLKLIRTFESLSVVASESMQHQTLAEVYRGLALAMRRLPPNLRAEVEGVVFRSVATLGDHALTAQLDDAIGELCATLPAGAAKTALEEARRLLKATHGTLNARSTRVQSSP